MSSSNFGTFDASTGQYKVSMPTALSSAVGIDMRAAANQIMAQLGDSNLPKDARDLGGALARL
jgi:hypothetical protein